MRPADQVKGPDSVGAEVEAGGIKDLPGRVDRYGKAKVAALDVAKYMREVQHLQERPLDQLYRDVSQRVEQCGG